MAVWYILYGLLGFIALYYTLFYLSKYLITRNVTDKDEAEEQIEGVTTMLGFVMGFLALLWVAGTMMNYRPKEEL